MKGYFRNKISFYGTEEPLKELAKKLGEGDGEQALLFERILPLEEDTQEARKAAWGISELPEEMECVLWRNGTILEYDFNTEEHAPIPVFQKLAQLASEFRMRVEYASDEYGENCGCYESKEGSDALEEQEIDDPLVFACDLWGVDPDEEMAERMINAYEE